MRTIIEIEVDGKKYKAQITRYEDYFTGSISELGIITEGSSISELEENLLEIIKLYNDKK